MHEAAVSGSPFALVLSDVMMPGVDGFQLAYKSRRNPISRGRQSSCFPPLTGSTTALDAARRVWPLI